jgi:hypothetical protein
MGRAVVPVPTKGTAVNVPYIKQQTKQKHFTGVTSSPFISTSTHPFFPYPLATSWLATTDI